MEAAAGFASEKSPAPISGQVPKNKTGISSFGTERSLSRCRFPVGGCVVHHRRIVSAPDSAAIDAAVQRIGIGYIGKIIRTHIACKAFLRIEEGPCRDASSGIKVF